MPEAIQTIIPGHAIVIGAGIAGACTAASLARRGWQVIVLDAAATPAGGASALPAGLYAPYLSADHNLTSQITAIGVPMMKQLAQSLLVEGVDWQSSGVLERKRGHLNDIVERWHPEAGWLKPAALVQACLAQPGVTWRGNCDVKRLVREGDTWSALDDSSQTIAQADLLVIAAAQGSADMLSTIPGAPKLNLQPVRGQVTYGDLSDIFDISSDIPAPDRPSHPVNGNGSFIATDKQWMVGAGYERDSTCLTPTVADQVANFERLQSLLPDVAESLKPRFQRGEVRNWVGVRCTYRDRLPIIGAVSPQLLPGLWLCTAMASRGLTLAPLCAELLAAQLHGEPLPLNVRQTRALGIERLR